LNVYANREYCDSSTLEKPMEQSRMYGIINSAEIRHIVLSILIF